MSNEGYHEPLDELSEETRDMHRAITSLMEELEAVDWYNQRVDACRNKELKAILAHNRDEEKEHASMVLEWIRRQDHRGMFLYGAGVDTPTGPVIRQGTEGLPVYRQGDCPRIGCAVIAKRGNLLTLFLLNNPYIFIFGGPPGPAGVTVSKCASKYQNDGY